MKNNNQIIANILDAYSKYVEFSYPKDPNIYVIRANAKTKEALLKASSSVVFSLTDHDLIDPDNSFMGFRVNQADHLSDNQLEFGPETVVINWSS